MRLSSPHPQIRKSDGCVVSYCPIASAIGARLLRQGGNAVDAAVATAFALAVTYPQAGNLGGGGFLVLKRPSEPVRHLDFREVAPRGVSAGRFSGAPEQTIHGALAVGVPGTVAGLAEAQTRFGRLSWKQVIAPAVELADKGVWLTARQAGYLRVHHEQLTAFASTRGYYTDGGTPFLPGTHFRQPDLARTLEELAAEGGGSFYRGAIAARIASEIAGHGGALDEEDLGGYRVRWREALRARVFDTDIYTASPPAVGGALILIALRLLESAGVRSLAPQSEDRLALLARVFRVSSALRQHMAGDPDHVGDTILPATLAHLEQAGSPGALERFEEAIATRPRIADTGASRPSTTHLCTLDPDGGAVSMTLSLNTMFGSKLAVSGAGFLLNSSIDDFHHGRANWYELAPEHHNGLAPGRRPASSIAPTLVTEGDDVLLAIGASGGPRIPTLVTQVLLRVLADDVAVSDAMRAPRLHHQFEPDELAVERTMPRAFVQGLASRGHRIVEVPLLGIGAAIEHDPASAAVDAALDHRMTVE